MLEWGHKSAGSIPVLQDETVVARIRASSWRERADVEMTGAPWAFFKRSGELHAVRDGHTGGMLATRPAMFRQRWDVQADAQTYRIQSAGFMSSRYSVLRDGVSIGESGTPRFWSNRPTLDVDASVPLEHQVFLLWVAFIIRRRTTGTSAGSSAAGGGGA